MLGCQRSFFRNILFLTPKPDPAKFIVSAAESVDSGAIYRFIGVDSMVNKYHVNKFPGIAHFKATDELPSDATLLLS